MAKIKGKLIKENKVEPLVYTKRKSYGDDWTHNVKSVKIKSKRKKEIILCKNLFQKNL